MTVAELAEMLERLDALFVELYNYAESQSLSDTMSKSGANALRAIKGSIGNRYNVIPQAAARLRAMEEALKPFADWADHHPASTHDHYVPECEIDGPGHSLTITLGEFRKARAVLSGEGQ